MERYLMSSAGPTPESNARRHLHSFRFFSGYEGSWDRGLFDKRQVDEFSCMYDSYWGPTLVAEMVIGGVR